MGQKARNRDKGGPRLAEATRADRLGDKIRIYVGPTIPGMPHGQVLGRELSGLATRMIEECPAIGRLIVPLFDRKQALRSIGRIGSRRRQDQDAVLNHYRR